MGDFIQSTNGNGYAFASAALPQGNHTHAQMNGRYNHNQTNGGSANHTNSAQQIQDEPMDTTMSSRSSAKQQQAIDNLRKELLSHAEDKPRPYKEDVRKTPIKDESTENKYIMVAIRGQGTKTTAIQIKRTSKLDDFITEVNSASGLGSNGNSNVVFKGTELSRGTGKTVEQAGLKDGSIVDVCVRTVGG